MTKISMTKTKQNLYSFGIWFFEFGIYPKDASHLSFGVCCLNFWNCPEVVQKQVRVSAGIEHIEDIIINFEQTLTAYLP